MGEEKKIRISKRRGREISRLVEGAWSRFLVRVDKAGVREARKIRALQDLQREANSQEGDLSP
jgi:hypothetical protein